MNEKFLLLERSIQQDLEAIDRIYASIGTGHLADDASEEEVLARATS